MHILIEIAAGPRTFRARWISIFWQSIVKNGQIHAARPAVSVDGFRLRPGESTGDGGPGRCCTLSISPLLRELIIELAEVEDVDDASDPMIDVLLTQLPRMPVQQLHLPNSFEPRLADLANALATDPADRSTLA